MAAKKKNGNGHKTPTPKNALDAIFEAVTDLKKSVGEIRQTMATKRDVEGINNNLLKLHRRLRKIEDILGLDG